MAFLGDFGKFFGLGSSEEVLGDVGAGIGGFISDNNPRFISAGRSIGGRVGEATSSLAGGGTADQPLQQSALPTPRPEDLFRRQETAFSGTNQAFISPFSGLVGGLPTLTKGLSRFLTSPTGVGTAVGTAVGSQFTGGRQMSMRPKPVLTQSRRNKAQVRRLADFVGIEGASEILSEKLMRSVTPSDVINLLLRTFRNDGAFITKAQVRNLRRTTNRFKSLEKQVKEATSMTRTTRRSPMRKSTSTTLIRN